MNTRPLLVSSAAALVALFSTASFAQCNDDGYVVTPHLVNTGSVFLNNKVTCWGDASIGDWRNPTAPKESVTHNYQSSLRFSFTSGLNGQAFCTLEKVGARSYKMTINNAVGRTSDDPLKNFGTMGVDAASSVGYDYYISACRALCIKAP